MHYHDPRCDWNVSDTARFYDMLFRRLNDQNSPHTAGYALSSEQPNACGYAKYQKE